MALIECPECGKEVSNQARACIHCGYPLTDTKAGSTVRIKMPNNLVVGWVGLFSSRDCSIEDSKGKVLWAGQHGENASFSIKEPMDIVVNLGSWGNPVSGTVEPNKKYSLVQDLGVHMFATFRLTEVDVIDSD